MQGLTFIIVVAAFLLPSASYAYGKCGNRVDAYRSQSAKVWSAEAPGRDAGLLQRTWEDLKNWDFDEPRSKRQLMTMLYVDLKNLVKPKFAPHVDAALLNSISKAIRCVKRDVRSAPRDRTKDDTNGIDAYFTREVKKVFGTDIKLGRPL